MQTDGDILRALRERSPAPVSAGELAESSGIPLECIAMRMKSLVSLRYVDRLSGDGAEEYALAPGADWPSDVLEAYSPASTNGRRPAEATPSREPASAG